VGVTAVPDPIADMDWDGWMYHRFFDVHGAAGTFDATEPQASIQFEVDSKAMRKIPLNETLVAVLEVVEQGASTGTAWFDSRILVKLP